MSLIYLDYNSTTPVDENVLATMLPYFSEQFGNAASATHRFGWQAQGAIEKARIQTASLLNAEPSEIIFTSGATESINLALRGAAEIYRVNGNHIISVSTEHKAVLDTLNDLSNHGFSVSYLSVDRSGRINIDELTSLIKKETILVSIMMANNETGVLQDVEAIGKICHEHSVLFFSDITQATGKVRVDVNELNIDLASISAHKFYGPKGVGALYVRRRNPKVKLQPQITGGGHENGFRSGTLNVPGIVGLGAASEIALASQWNDAIYISSLRVMLEQQLENECGARINGNIKYRLPNTTNLLFANNKASDLISRFPDWAFSTGSACTSALAQPSHVLKAMGLTENEAYSSIRFSLGKYNRIEEIREVIAGFSEAINGFRENA